MLKAVVLLIVAMASIQVGATLAKGLFPLLGPAGTTALRVLFATILLWALFRPWKQSVSKAQMKRFLVYGVCLGVMNLTFYFALQRIPLGLAVALEFVGPLGVAIFTSRKKIDYLWAVLAALGIYLVLPAIQGEGALEPVGVFLALLAGVFWAGYILYGKRAGSEVSGILASTWGMTFAALVVVPVGLIMSEEKMFAAEVLPLGIAVAVLSSAVPYTLEMFSLKLIPTKTFGVLMSLEPAIAAVAGLIFLGEKLTPVQWLAMAFIMLASFGTALTAETSQAMNT